MRSLIVFLCFIFLAGCAAPQKSQAEIEVSVLADGKNQFLTTSVGSSVQDVLAQAGITLSTLDRSEPPLFTILGDGSSVKVIRIIEKFEIEQQVILFDHQTLRNESLPEGETRLSQPGANGVQELTYRILLEDGVEISRTVVKSVELTPAIPEIMLVGSQTPFQSVPISGKLAYLSAGNAWIMEGTTGERRLVVDTADLDGRIFSLAPDGKTLLFTRSSKDSNLINTLWAVRVEENNPPIDLKLVNIIHSASFSSDNYTIAFTTVEPRSTAPGWQANNNLLTLGLGVKGIVGKPDTILDVNSGGVYGWWGSTFSWDPVGKIIANVRPDGIILMNLEAKSQTNLLEILPFQTGGDWAWVPGVGWSPDGKILYTVSHEAKPGAQDPEKSPNFNLTSFSFLGGSPIALVQDVGMFAYPVPSPILNFNRVGSETNTKENSLSVNEVITGTVGNDANQVSKVNSPRTFQVAYLQALLPLQSDTSRYRLTVIDQDGSNKQFLFPEEGKTGLDPQRVVWSPKQEFDYGTYIGCIYQGNIWLVNSQNGFAQQITGDGLISKIDWR